MKEIIGSPGNELMETEDQLRIEMHDEYRKKLQSRLQSKLDAAQDAFIESNRLIKRRCIDVTLITTIGRIRLRAMKGYCPKLRKWIVPIREAWSLSKNQVLTPSLQKKLSCTACETGSFEKASWLAGEWGTSISDDAIRSCVLELGWKALNKPVSAPCQEKADANDTLIIMMDGWMARHRGIDWGKSKHAKAEERIRWHEIKSAIIYRLKDHAKTSAKRRSLISKHVVAVPAETDPVDFGRRVHDEAKRMGMGNAKRVYIVMDGGIWLWNIFEDRFSLCAEGTLDFYHASEHIHALSNELFKDDRQEAKNWSAKMLHSLRRHSTKNLFKTLEELIANPPNQDAETVSAIKSTSDYFQNHKDHMNYPAAAKAGLPIGSGSMESQCSQFQNRFKRRGQFWSKCGFAALLEVSIRFQNGEIYSLWAA
jgi:hypothetical protein